MMTASTQAQSVEARRRRLRADVVALVPDMQERAVALDAAGVFPGADIERLCVCGALTAPLPRDLGGLGLGIESDGALTLMDVLCLIGRGNQSVGRLYEAHVNVVRLVTRYGTSAQLQGTAELAFSGQLLGLWVTDAPDGPAHLRDVGMLHGAKAPCSGAGHLAHALITARMSDGATCMVMIGPIPAANADRSGWSVQGMRAACNGRVALEGVAASTPIGRDGDYLHEPDFSAGAWRGSAVALGGLEALVREMCSALTARGRAADPHQRARIGQALIALETARMWVWRAALIGESDAGIADDIIGIVNLARIAVESAGLDILRLAQRSLGLAAFRTGTLIELLLRDLATYLRQPATDITLDAAAAHFTMRDLPPLPCWEKLR
jgi:alkylation response protein AidB-like acyl-CoA dehydrogenase